ncbi:homocysteine S-methyltransferase family protein [Actibacterium pelagium]|uniref:Homocysteine S-methyltransferase n=1 Tax=Actibacterium pelagium TaxID=2029103 RepID=A0A917ENY2_9RHOB|nr:homocysteine S-methyltransferase family protein [Actibacterium pelagium]GGE60959.1 homocysteine S-methyltransferase [Actibacterium pelagium]
MSAKTVPLPRKDGVFYLAEGGIETEIMYRHGHPLREFAMFELVDNPQAMIDLKDMYRRYLDVAAAWGMGALMAGLDYRASPDWGRKLGYSADALADFQHRCIDFLREVSAPYADQLPAVVICGCAGPRGDAYSLNEDITEDSAQEYHATQMATLKAAKVDLVWGATFNNIPEAVGLSRAAAEAGLPLSLSFTLDSSHKLKSGPSLREAIELTDQRAGDRKPDSYGINCSHPVEFEPALEPGSWTDRIRSLRPNASKMEKVSLCRLGHIEEGDPVELGQLMGDLVRRYPNVDIVGGCCGTWDKHFEQIARNVTAVQ